MNQNKILRHSEMEKLPELVTLLKYSRKHIKGEEIEMRLFGVSLDGSRCRYMVNYLRRRRAPIGSDVNGYFWATRQSQLAHTRAHLWSRVKSAIAAIRGVSSPKWHFEVADIENDEIVVESSQLELI